MNHQPRMDIVWFKRDVRLHDHAGLAAIAPSVDKEVLLLYVHETDQLSEPTVHGSHIAFINEGLIDLDKAITSRSQQQEQKKEGQPNPYAKLSKSSSSAGARSGGYEFQSLTVCYGEIVDILEKIHKKRPVQCLFAHQETGHWESFMRDKRVRKFCKETKIPFVEFANMGVKRCLSSRDDFTKHFHAFMRKPLHPTPAHFRCSIVQLWSDDFSFVRDRSLNLYEVVEIPSEHRVDREDRQRGGEIQALAEVQTFLHRRGASYSLGISSPNTSWTSGSRLSPYLAWGHLSLRYLIQETKKRQAFLKQLRKDGIQTEDPRWPRSLSAFLSRLHWRSHFIQKLESEPEMEKRDLCPAYQHLRRQPGDWNDAYYEAWSTGNTGFPFLDACMRCLLKHGWINFRMRAMVVSFATYNLWLDWKRLAPHMARVFLDYEPGIHYPQLQMQSGTTGINALRVYNVIKQGVDQDPKGVFVRKYIPELHRVSDQYIHEPWSMSKAVQEKLGVIIGEDYPARIVDEKESARIAKQRISEVRKQNETKTMADQVYLKHGSRQRMGKDQSQSSKRVTANQNQPKITTFVARGPQEAEAVAHKKRQSSLSTLLKNKKRTKVSVSWSCNSCTFFNDNPLGLACIMCGTERSTAATTN